MRISPVNNNNKNTNFGMLKVTDANTPELVQEAWRLLIDMTQHRTGYKPFRIADALNPNYKPNVAQNEGGYYMGNQFMETRIKRYEQEGDTFIFDGELNKVEGKNWSLADRFDLAFIYTKQITMETLRALHIIHTTKKSIEAKAEAALARAKEETRTFESGAFVELGASFLNRTVSK